MDPDFIKEVNPFSKTHALYALYIRLNGHLFYFGNFANLRKITSHYRFQNALSDIFVSSGCIHLSVTLPT